MITRLRTGLEPPVEIPGVPSLGDVAIGLIRTQGSATTNQLADIGISRQCVHLLKKRGVLRRVRHGLYAEPSPD